MLYQEKIKAINEKLDISEQKLIEYASMPDIEEQLKDRMEALAAAQVRMVAHNWYWYFLPRREVRKEPLRVELFCYQCCGSRLVPIRIRPGYCRKIVFKRFNEILYILYNGFRFLRKAIIHLRLRFYLGSGYRYLPYFLFFILLR